MTDVASINLSDDAAQRPKSQNFYIETLRNLRRNRSAVSGFLILSFLIFIAVFAQLLAPYHPEDDVLLGKPRTAPCVPLFSGQVFNKQVEGSDDTMVEKPFITILGVDVPQESLGIFGCQDTTYLMGLDLNGRDEFSRILFGARVSLVVGTTSVIFAIFSGTILGLVAGYFGGWTDNIIMRLMDVLLAFPGLLLAITFVTIWGPGLSNALIAISIVFIPAYARVTRSSVLSVKETEFVMAEVALGASSPRIIFRHILPHAMTPLIVQATLGIGTAILDAAALSFLGLGAQRPTPEWGQMLSEARNYMFVAPHLVVFPGIAIMLTVLSFNLLGDGLRDALDPRLNRNR